MGWPRSIRAGRIDATLPSCMARPPRPIKKACTYLVLIRASHRLHDVLSLLLGDAAVLGNDSGQDRVDLTSHVRCVAADVEVGLLLEELVDELGVLLEAVLDVDLFGAVAREGRDELEVVAEGLLVLLWCVSGGSKGRGVWSVRLGRGLYLLPTLSRIGSPASWTCIRRTESSSRPGFRQQLAQHAPGRKRGRERLRFRGQS